MINVLIAIDDFSPESGESHIVPISHLWDPPNDQGHAEIIADMRPASTIVLHRLEESKRQRRPLSCLRQLANLNHTLLVQSPHCSQIRPDFLPSRRAAERLAGLLGRTWKPVRASMARTTMPTPRKPCRFTTPWNPLPLLVPETSTNSPSLKCSTVIVSPNLYSSSNPWNSTTRRLATVPAFLAWPSAALFAVFLSSKPS